MEKKEGKGKCNGNCMEKVIKNLLLWRSVTRLTSHQPPHAGYYNFGYLTSELERFLLELRNEGYGKVIDKLQKEVSLDDFQQKVLHLDATPEELLEKIVTQQEEAIEKIFTKKKKSKEESESEMKYVG